MRRYRYVGPEEIRAAAVGATTGTPLHRAADARTWVGMHLADREGASIPATFVVMPDGVARVAPRRSEHVACAGGSDVLSAGEMFFAPDGRVVRVSNHSTGFCPEPASWVAVAAALDRAGIAHPDIFDPAIDFRRCPACDQRNIVKDSHFVCAVCDADLPEIWNFE